MEVAITKISQNGQIVIPAEIMKDAGIKPLTKFIVTNRGGNIFLKQVRKDKLDEDITLIENIERSEDEISKGKVVKADTKMSAKEIDNLLMS
jgi:AbrB family looped-hinge helix DNA binding protein|tara:strand:+ start:257 stop:532 length:276 start_codon:yes stop_codon:yes gene_type:complete